MPLTRVIRDEHRRAHVRTLIVWFSGGLILFGLLWAGVAAKLSHERAEMLAQSRMTLMSLADSQSQQMENLIQQVDQVTLFLASLPRGAGRTQELQRMFDKLPAYSVLNPLYIDKDGIVRASRTPSARGKDVSQSAAFLRQRDAPSPNMIINPSELGVGYLKGKTVIRFTRAIFDEREQFDGIISIALLPEQLMNAGAISVLSTGDLIGLKFAQGEWLGHQIKGQLAPRFGEPDPRIADTQEQETDTVVAGKESLASWVGMTNYPLVTVVAITRENALAALQETEIAYQLLLSMGAGMVLLISLTGAWMQVRRSERRRFEEQVQSTFRLAVDGAREELFMLSQFHDPVRGQIDFRIEDCNAQASRIAGLPRAKMLGTPLSAIMTGRNFEATRLFLMSAMNEGFAEKEALLFRRGLGEKRWYHCRAIRAELGLAVTLRDIDEIKQKEMQLQAMALTDALTGLPNRHWVNHHLPQLIRVSTDRREHFAALFIDLDNFKNINDSFGHRAGDNYLIGIAAALKASVRQEDHVIRLGGDEFMVLLLDLPSAQAAEEIAAQLLAGLRSVKIDDDAAMPARASVGIALFPDDATSAEALVQAADIAMYEAKRGGKGRYMRYTLDMHAYVSDRVGLQTALEQAVPGNQLVLYLQPRINALTGRLAGFEALLRWQHPVLGLVSPERFIPLAEESNLILDLGNWVATSTCELLARWRSQGHQLYPISINVSAQQLRSSDFRERLDATMRRHQILSSQIAIELTESTMVGDDQTILHELRSLEGMGMRLMIDDFGTGYSSIAQLQRMKVDVLKIDQSFVHNLALGTQGVVLCEAMIQIGKSLGIAVVAEGVETEEQLAILQRMGCDEVQGFLISRPVPADQAITLLEPRQFFEPMPTAMARRA